MKQEKKRGTLFKLFPVMCAIWYVVEGIKMVASILHTKAILGDAYYYDYNSFAVVRNLFGGIAVLFVAVIWILLFLHHKTGQYGEVLKLLYAGSILYVIYHLLCLLPAFYSRSFIHPVYILICVVTVLIEKVLLQSVRTKAPVKGKERKCPNCSASVKEGDLFCKSCGAKLSDK